MEPALWKALTIPMSFRSHDDQTDTTRETKSGHPLFSKLNPGGSKKLLPRLAAITCLDNNCLIVFRQLWCVSITRFLLHGPLASLLWCSQYEPWMWPLLTLRHQCIPIYAFGDLLMRVCISYHAASSPLILTLSTLHLENCQKHQSPLQGWHLLLGIESSGPISRHSRTEIPQELCVDCDSEVLTVQIQIHNLSACVNATHWNALDILTQRRSEKWNCLQKLPSLSQSTLTQPVPSPCPASAQQVDCQSQKPISICRCCPGHKTHPLPFLRTPLSEQNQIETAASLKELANLFQGPLPNLSNTQILAQGSLELAPLLRSLPWFSASPACSTFFLWAILQKAWVSAPCHLPRPWAASAWLDTQNTIAKVGLGSKTRLGQV